MPFVITMTRVLSCRRSDQAGEIRHDVEDYSLRKWVACAITTTIEALRRLSAID
jgi:hypothetical protein